MDGKRRVPASWQLLLYAGGHGQATSTGKPFLEAPLSSAVLLCLCAVASLVTPLVFFVHASEDVALSLLTFCWLA